MKPPDKLERLALFAISVVIAACQIKPHVVGGDKVASVTYYDFNNDGRPDYEFHQRPLINRVPGFLWTREDNNYDGYYDTQTIYGTTICISEPIHIPVPRIDTSADFKSIKER